MPCHNVYSTSDPVIEVLGSTQLWFYMLERTQLWILFYPSGFKVISIGSVQVLF